MKEKRCYLTAYDMKILGLHSGFTLGQHDPAAALVVDGQIVAACEEERFTRVKSAYGTLPLHSIRQCLKIGTLDIHDIDLVVHPGKLYPEHQQRLQMYLKHYFGYAPRIMMIEHQVAHLASAFFASGFDQAMCLSYDGYGERLSAALGVGSSNGLQVLETRPASNSLGVFYSTMTSFLGFRVGEDEYKVMGLAPYGGSGIDLSDFAHAAPDGYHIDESYILQDFGDLAWEEPMYTQKLVQLLGEPRRPDSPITQHYKSVAYATQVTTEACAVSLVRHLHRVTGLENLCMAGGVGLNCSVNRVLAQLPFVKRIFVQPASSDRGLALGCALYGAQQCGDPIHAMEHAYLGSGYSEQATRYALELTGMTFCEPQEPPKLAAEFLSEGKIIGWFQGRSEYGPRALGNRSILADPRRAQMKDEINRRIKFREEFRPFAPSVLEEHAPELFDCTQPLPYMTVAVSVHEEWRSRIAAVVHVNGTARLQTVSQAQAPLYYRLVHEFYDLTGIPAILNTSFNIRGQPIVDSPLDALATFAATGLDALFLGPYLVTKVPLQAR